MRCLAPKTVGFLADGKTISWSNKKFSKEFAPFQLPCSKCIECRLEYARQWAVRCVHEAKMHPHNVFVTLTYSDEHLESPKLNYEHFQRFMKRLRKTSNEKIGIFVTGEYGDLTKRPHWHAIIFNWQPPDLEKKYITENDDQVYSSKTLDKLWGYGITEAGSVTFESAGYCARYAAKKLVHGRDQDHDFQPISKKSSKNAIGKKFLELYWQDIFNYGKCILDSGQETSIPRYYEKWLLKNQPAAWENYITQTKRKKCENAAQRQATQMAEEIATQDKRIARGNFQPPNNNKVHRTKIIAEKFKRLQHHLKGDI